MRSCSRARALVGLANNIFQIVQTLRASARPHRAAAADRKTVEECVRALASTRFRSTPGACSSCVLRVRPSVRPSVCVEAQIRFIAFYFRFIDIYIYILIYGSVGRRSGACEIVRIAHGPVGRPPPPIRAADGRARHAKRPLHRSPACVRRPADQSNRVLRFRGRERIRFRVHGCAMAN